MKLKIMSDGTPDNTSVVNAETGEIVEGVASIKWECLPLINEGMSGHEVYCYLELYKMPLEVVADNLVSYALKTEKSQCTD